MLWLLNILLKLATVVAGSFIFLYPDWPQFAGKAMQLRFYFFTLAILLIPLWWFVRGRKQPYPHLADALFSIPFILDLVGNDLGGYGALPWYDMLTHSVNPFIFGLIGLMLVFAWAPQASRFLVGLSVMGLMATGHLLWEGIEFLTQYLPDATNLGLTYTDTLSDLFLGLLASVLVFIIATLPFWKARWVQERVVAPLRSLR